MSAGGFGYKTRRLARQQRYQPEHPGFFFQTAITPELNAQVEFRRRDSDFGDLAFNFDPDSFSPNFEAGIRPGHLPRRPALFAAPSSDFLLSFIYGDLTNDINTTTFFSNRLKTTDKGTQTEGQYIFREDLFNVTAGFGYSDVDRNFDLI